VWFKQVKGGDKQPGLYPSIQKMPFSESLLKFIVDEFGFDKDYSVKCLEANRHNHITATYHLINKKNQRMSSVKDSYSSLHDEKKRGVSRLQTDPKP